MAEKGHQQEEYASTDLMGTAQTTNTSEPVTSEPLRYVGSESDLSSSTEPEKEKGRHGRRVVDRTLTTTTTTSSVAPYSVAAEPAKKKPWYKRLNPLKRSKKPPVPKERIVSREYGASFFSMMTFQWMAPIMTVGFPIDDQSYALGLLLRLGGIPTNIRAQRHLACKPRTECRCTISKTQCVFQETSCARR